MEQVTQFCKQNFLNLLYSLVIAGLLTAMFVR